MFNVISSRGRSKAATIARYKAMKRPKLMFENTFEKEGKFSHLTIWKGEELPVYSFFGHWNGRSFKQNTIMRDTRLGWEKVHGFQTEWCR